jgi:hypothetical protein
VPQREFLPSFDPRTLENSTFKPPLNPSPSDSSDFPDGEASLPREFKAAVETRFGLVGFYSSSTGLGMARRVQFS